MGIEDYISEDEKYQIAKDIFTEQCRLRSKEDFERIINNSAYSVVWQAVDECFDEDAQQMLRDKVVAIIDRMTYFNVFSVPNAWDRQENMAYGVLMQSVRDNKDKIDAMIEFGVDNLTRKQKAEIAYQATMNTLNKGK